MANLSSMFAQLNEAIQQNPLATRGDGLIDTMSLNAGRLASNLPGQDPKDPYRFMTKGAKERAGMMDIGQLGSIDTVEKMQEAARIYGATGNTQESVAMTQAARSLQKEQAAEMEANADEIKRELDNKRLMREAFNKGDMELVRALQSGAITAADWRKQKLLSDLKISEAAAMRDPYEGAFTETVNLGGKEVPVRFNRKGDPIAILGEGRRDVLLTDVWNDESGAMQKALVDKNNPQNIQFLGTAQPRIDTFDIRQSGDKFVVFRSPADGGMPERVAVYNNLSDAEQAQKEIAADSRSVNLLATIDEAIAQIDDEDKWVGGFESWVMKYLPETDARAFEALITGIKANVGFDELRQLKAEGGTLGQVSNIENILLQSAIRQLDSASEPVDLRAALQTIKEVKARLRTASKTNDPDSLFQAEKDEAGNLTGRKMYMVNDGAIAIINADGSYGGLVTR